jgi:hypothetical protein
MPTFMITKTFREIQMREFRKGTLQTSKLGLEAFRSYFKSLNLNNSTVVNAEAQRQRLLAMVFYL